jgi:hypothetical protein
MTILPDLDKALKPIICIVLRKLTIRLPNVWCKV